MIHKLEVDWGIQSQNPPQNPTWVEIYHYVPIPNPSLSLTILSLILMGWLLVIRLTWPIYILKIKFRQFRRSRLDWLFTAYIAIESIMPHTDTDMVIMHKILQFRESKTTDIDANILSMT